MNLQKEKHKPRQHRKVPIYITAHGRTGGANPRTRRSFRQSNHCRENWSPSGCYCLCPRRPQSSGYCLWTPYCHCRCCRHHGSPSPEQRRLLENTHTQKQLRVSVYTHLKQRHLHTTLKKRADVQEFLIFNKNVTHTGVKLCDFRTYFRVHSWFNLFMEFVDIK